MIARDLLASLMERERTRFREEHPESGRLYARARSSMLGGVPMAWMAKWPGGHPVFVERAEGAHFVCADGHGYVDLCLGDTGAMTGHSPPAALDAIQERLHKGITMMLPTEDSLWVAEELTRRFGLPYWQFALTATDANRFSIRLAREVTQRPKVLVFNYCYHGTVDETFASLIDGRTGPRRGNIGPPVDPSVTTKVVEFNDLGALEEALAPRDVACVLAEPAMTNVGIIHPDEGFHEALRRITRATGTLLIVDETHTICTGFGGYTRSFGLEPDFFVVGKPVASGIPAAVYGFTTEVGERIKERTELEDIDVGGIGGTLAGNALSVTAMRATLESVLTEEAFDHMLALGRRFTEGVQECISRRGLPWHVTRLGCRAEYLFGLTPPRNGSEAIASSDFELETFMHLYALNRGVLLTPFHNMALMCPATTAADVDRHTEVFGEATAELTA